MTKFSKLQQEQQMREVYNIRCSISYWQASYKRNLSLYGDENVNTKICKSNISACETQLTLLLKSN